MVNGGARASCPPNCERDARAPLLPDIIADLFLREGAGYASYREHAELHRLKIRWEWASGQWVMMVGPDNRLWGWASWYRVTDEILARIEAEEIEDLVRGGDPRRDLMNGPHVYGATAVVAPWAPLYTYRRLCRLVEAANPDAQEIAAYRRRRNGAVRWIRRPVFVIH